MDSPTSHLPRGLASLLIDLDGLKSINDDHGHEAGDAALLLVSDVLRDATRPQDVVVRLGGDEFLVVLPGLGADQAVLVGERIVEQIASSRPADPWSSLRLTASVGVAIVRSRGIPMDSLDEALYTGKRLGGGRVVLAETRNSGRVR
jgi:diguanylate cyclase (GGDEF)-like protein